MLETFTTRYEASDELSVLNLPWGGGGVTPL